MKSWIGLLAVLLMAGGASAQESRTPWSPELWEQEVPRDDPAYQDISILDNIVNIHRFKGRPEFRRVMSSYEAAVEIAGTLQFIDVINEYKKIGIVLTAREQMSAAALQESLPVQMALARLIKRFYFEVVALGLEPRHLTFATRELAAGRGERLFRDLASPFTDVARPFPDVPPSHWAFEAVEYLRFSGVVTGYPDGTYNLIKR